MKLPLLLVIVLFLLFFVGLWCAICCILSLSSGWYALSKTYSRRTTTPTPGQTFGMSSMSVRSASSLFGALPARYNNCLSITVGQQGIDISMFPLWRLLHPPLLIPWNAIESCTEAQDWLSRYVQVTLVTSQKQFIFHGKAADAILEGYRLSI